MSSNTLSPRGPAWNWWVCGLLLLATMLNYMDRLTLNLTAVRIMFEFRLDAQDYGQLESAFAFAFALGAITFGWLADRYSVRWLYPIAVIGWSVAGFATGLVGTFFGLLMCRFALGLFEAGNWPCALRTTQRILPPEQRTLGNSILQSGAAIGAVITPLIVLALVIRGDEAAYPTWFAGLLGHTVGQAQVGAPPTAAFAWWIVPTYQPGAWRSPFLIVGAIGMTWVVLWLLSVRRGELPAPTRTEGPSLMSLVGRLVTLFGLDIIVQFSLRNSGFIQLAPGESLPWWLSLPTKVCVSVGGITLVAQWLLKTTEGDDRLPRGLFLRRFAVVCTTVVAINITWHFFRAWLPLFLQKQHGYTEAFTTGFFVAYYIATDIGSLGAGFAALLLSRWGVPVHLSRLVVFIGCALLCTLSVCAALLPTGDLLLAVLLVIGFATLGLFPLHYSFSQDLTVKHQGKLSGALGCINWLAMYLLHETVGTAVKQTGSNTLGVALAGLAPLVGVAALVLLWGKDAPKANPQPAQ